MFIQDFISSKNFKFHTARHNGWRTVQINHADLKCANKCDLSCKNIVFVTLRYEVHVLDRLVDVLEEF